MPSDKTILKGGRAMLNLPGEHSTAAMVAEIKKQHGDDRWVNAQVSISDCARTIHLEFPLSDQDDYDNGLYKVDTMLGLLRDFKKAWVAEGRRQGYTG